ncbi:hypothetical protein D3C72_2347360 [compost metagenome]
MDIVELKRFLLYCLAINYSILLLWFLVFSCAHDGLLRLHNRWFQLSRERFDALHYAAMALYKTGVLLLNLTPWLALQLMG